MAAATKPTNRIKDVEKNGKPAELPNIMESRLVTFRIRGISPLLQNNPAEFIGKGGGDGLATGKKKYDDAEEASLRTYRNADGEYCAPTESFLKSAISAVRGKKFGKLFASATLMGSVFVVEPWSLLEDYDGKLLRDYEIDRRSVVVGKARVLRCRPMWFPWQVRIALDIDTAIILPDQVLASLALAGRIKGSGDYRPEKGGGFGRFTAELME